MHAYGLRDTVPVPGLGQFSFQEVKYELQPRELDGVVVPDPDEMPATFSERMTLPKEFYVPAKPSLYSRVAGAVSSWTERLNVFSRLTGGGSAFSSSSSSQPAEGSGGDLFTRNAQGRVTMRMRDEPCLSAFAYHPRLDLWAVALPKDQSVRFYSRTSQSWLQLTLKHQFQTGIRSIQWNPIGGGSLAVACTTGVCLWHFPFGFPSSSSNAESHRTRGGAREGHKGSGHRKQNSAWMTHLTREGHKDVRRVEFSPCGRYLMSSDGSWTLVVWNVAKPFSNATPLTTVGCTAGVICWSARGDKVLVSSAGRNEFRVWNSRDWTYTKWSTAAQVVDACWNDTGNELLIATEANSQVYTVSLNRSVRGLQTSVVLDTTQHAPVGADLEGASVSSMKWDSTGRRLAVSYTNADGSQSDLLALFDTEYRDKVILQFTFIGFVRGPCPARKGSTAVLGGGDMGDIKSVKKVAFKMSDTPTASNSPDISFQDGSALKRKFSGDQGSVDNSLDFAGDLNVTPVPKKSSHDDSAFFSPQSKFIPPSGLKPTGSKRASEAGHAAKGLLSPEFLTTPKQRNPKKQKLVEARIPAAASGFLSGGSNHPLCFEFKPSVEYGALLAVCWRERHITTVPMYFEDSRAHARRGHSTRGVAHASGIYDVPDSLRARGGSRMRPGVSQNQSILRGRGAEHSTFVHPLASKPLMQKYIDNSTSVHATQQRRT
jgi:hypothetical protein